MSADMMAFYIYSKYILNKCFKVACMYNLGSRSYLHDVFMDLSISRMLVIYKQGMHL